MNLCQSKGLSPWSTPLREDIQPIYDIMLSCRVMIISTKKIKKNREKRIRDRSEETFEYRINLGTEISESGRRTSQQKK